MENNQRKSRNYEMSTLMVIDAANLNRRAHCGFGDCRNSDGFPVGAITGWIYSILRLREYKPDHMVAIFEGARCPYRTSICKEYKAHRSERPEDYELQIPAIKTLATYFGIHVIQPVEYEADDLVAQIVNDWVVDGNRATIISSDKDFVPLLCDDVTIMKPENGGKWSVVTVASATERYGVRPDQFQSWLALNGDSADGFPGVYKVGPKTATQLLQSHGSLEAIMGADLPGSLGALLKLDETKALLDRNMKLVRFRAVTMDTQEATPGKLDLDAAMRELYRLKLGSLAGKVARMID